LAPLQTKIPWIFIQHHISFIPVRC
jgi:hypothetical protein